MKHLLAALDPVTNPAVTGMTDPTKAPDMLARIISSLVSIILSVATIWTLIQLLQGGIMWINSGGDKTALEAAQSRLTNAFIGLFILFAGWAIYLLILQFLGIGLIGSNGQFNLNLPGLIE